MIKSYPKKFGREIPETLGRPNEYWHPIILPTFNDFDGWKRKEGISEETERQVFSLKPRFPFFQLGVFNPSIPHMHVTDFRIPT